MNMSALPRPGRLDTHIPMSLPGWYLMVGINNLHPNVERAPYRWNAPRPYRFPVRLLQRWAGMTRNSA